MAIYTKWHFGLSTDMIGIDIPALNQWLSKRLTMQDLIKQHLLRAQSHVKLHVDKHRSKREFAVVDLVFLKLQPYVQSSLAHRSHQKLAFHFFRSFQDFGADWSGGL